MQTLLAGLSNARLRRGMIVINPLNGAGIGRKKGLLRKDTRRF